MDAVLLKNGHGHLGIAVVADDRLIKDVVYDCIPRTIIINFANGKNEALATEVDLEFHKQLLNRKEIFIAHYPNANFAGEPTQEYLVQLVR